MKKFITTFVSVCLLFVLPSAAVAAEDGQEYSLDELHMKISMPDDYIVLTRDIKELPDVFAESGQTVADMQKDFEAKHIYLEALKADFTDEIIITMTSQDQIYDMQTASETDLDKIAKAMLDLQANKNDEAQEILDTQGVEKMQFLDYTYSRYPEVTYLKLNKKMTQTGIDMEINGLQYFTVKNGQSVNIVMNSYTGPLTDDQKNQLDQMVKTANYENIPEPANFKKSGGIDWAEVGIVGLISGVAAGTAIGLYNYFRKKRKGT